MSSVSDALRRMALVLATLVLALVALPAWATLPDTGLASLEDEELAAITGQNGSLFLADHIGPNELVGAPGNGSANFDFYRMGMDVKLSMNMNAAKFQLGCGGVNDLLTTTPACDIDIDYLSFMGINNAGTFPSPDGPDSTFELIRPYIELAIKNDGNPTLREVVGIKIGGQRINGAMSIGRDYLGVETLGREADLLNQENGGTCNPNATIGQGVLNCHSGINSISGFLSLEMSSAIRARANLMGFITTDLNTCFGRMNPSQYGCNNNTTPFFVDAGGTRMQNLHVAAAKLNIDHISLNCAWWNIAVCGPVQLFANALIDQGYGQLVINTRAVHYLLTPNTENFFLSLQREPISWPNYSKSPPPSNLLYDACNPTYGQRTDRCSSAYSPMANTGWWLNAPGAKILNINPPNRLEIPGTLSAGTVLSLLGPEGQLVIDNPRVDLRRVGNCHGSALFC